MVGRSCILETFQASWIWHKQWVKTEVPADAKFLMGAELIYQSNIDKLLDQQFWDVFIKDGDVRE